MRSEDYWRQITTVSKGTAQPGANASVLANLTLPLPPRNEMTRIVQRLTTGLERVSYVRESLEPVAGDINRLRQSILAAAFRGDRTADWREKNPDVEPASVLLDRIRSERVLAGLTKRGRQTATDKPNAELRELPRSWAWATLDSLAAVEENSITDGPFGSNLKTEDYVAGGVRVIRLGNIGVGAFRDGDRSYVSLQKAAALTKHAAEPGDLIIAALADPVGRACLLPTSVQTAIVKADCVRARLHSAIRHAVVMHWLNSPLGRAEVERHSHGIGRLRVNLQELKRVFVPLAPTEEQNAMLDALDDDFRLISEVEEIVGSADDQMNALESAILAKAFRGELVPQDPNDEPASVLLERIRSQRAATEGKPKRQRRTKTRGRESTSEPEPAAIVEATAPRLPIRRRVAAPEPQSARPTIAEVPLEDLLAAIRRALASGPRDRDTLIRDVARELGFARTGDRVYAAIVSAITTASRRLIVRSERGVFTLYSPSIEAYGKEELKTLFLSAIGTTWHDREDAIRTTARYLGFKRTGEIIDVRLRSVINGLIREQRLERDGSAIRRI